MALPGLHFNQFLNQAPIPPFHALPNGGGNLNQFFNNLNLNNFAVNPPSPQPVTFQSLLQNWKPGTLPQTTPGALEQIWNTIRNYRPGPAEIAAFTAVTTAAAVKIADKIVTHMKLQKHHLREQRAAHEINNQHYNNAGVFERAAQFLKPESPYINDFFEFDINDPREKFLYLSAVDDHNGALEPKYVASLLATLDKTFDLKFSVIDSYDTLCHEINAGAISGKLTNIIIDAHGDSSGQHIQLRESPNPNALINEASVKSKPSCFSGLQPHRRILLSSCCTGSLDTGCSIFPSGSISRFKRPLGTDNIAETLADQAQRTVVAPKTSIIGSQTKIASTLPDPTMLYHPTTENDLNNSFKIFNPRITKSKFDQCKNISWDQLHPKELIAMDAIKLELVANGFLPESPQLADTQEYLRTCRSDPKAKVLYLSATYDPENSLDPKNRSELLGLLAQNYDLKFKTISSKADICREISDAAATGSIASVIIDAKEMGDSFLLSKTETDSQTKLAPHFEWLSVHTDFGSCFSPLSSSGTIIFPQGATGAAYANDRNNNLAQKIATKVNVLVVAPNQELSTLSEIHLLSTDPLTLFAPEYSDPSKNVFQTFVPGDQPKVIPLPNCLSKDCPPLLEYNAHPYEVDATKLVDQMNTSILSRWTQSLFGSSPFKRQQEFLRLRADDPREKFLHFKGHSDGKGALNSGMKISSLLDFAKDFDIKYQIVDSRNDICEGVKDAAKTGNVANIIIEGLAGDNEIKLSQRSDGKISIDQDFSTCFEDLASDGRIILDTNKAGSIHDYDGSLAQKIANSANRKVVLATDSIYSQNPNQNAFKIFSPEKHKDEL